MWLLTETDFARTENCSYSVKPALLVADRHRLYSTFSISSERRFKTSLQEKSQASGLPTKSLFLSVSLTRLYQRIKCH